VQEAPYCADDSLLTALDEILMERVVAAQHKPEETKTPDLLIRDTIETVEEMDKVTDAILDSMVDEIVQAEPEVEEPKADVQMTENQEKVEE
jgi:hypothetical protein